MNEDRLIIQAAILKSIAMSARDFIFDEIYNRTSNKDTKSIEIALYSVARFIYDTQEGLLKDVHGIDVNNDLVLIKGII